MDIPLHAALVEVHEVGVLIRGQSGVGKSESALELVQRGHRLVADDVVRLESFGADSSEKFLMGRSPESIRHYMELRGVGLLDIAQLYGASAVRDEARVELICRLEPWMAGMEYERTGLERPREEVLGVKIPALTLPLRSTGGMASLIEVAAMDHRSRSMGNNAARQLDERLKESGTARAWALLKGGE